MTTWVEVLTAMVDEPSKPITGVVETILPEGHSETFGWAGAPPVVVGLPSRVRMWRDGSRLRVDLLDGTPAFRSDGDRCGGSARGVNHRYAPSGGVSITRAQGERSSRCDLPATGPASTTSPTHRQTHRVRRIPRPAGVRGRTGTATAQAASHSAGRRQGDRRGPVEPQRRVRDVEFLCGVRGARRRGRGVLLL